MATYHTDGDDFYVEPYDDGSPVFRAWLVHRGRPPSICCVSVCPDRETAVVEATNWATAESSLGHPSSVYIRDTTAEPWRVLQR